MTTVETGLALDKDAPLELGGFFALRNGGLRRAWSAPLQRGLTQPKTRPLLAELGLTSIQTGSIVEEAATRYRMLRELKETELAAARTGHAERRTAISETRAHLRALERRIAKDHRRRRVAQHRRRPMDAGRDRPLRNLRASASDESNWSGRKSGAITRKERQIARHEHDLGTGRVSLCIGLRAPLSRHPHGSPAAARSGPGPQAKRVTATPRGLRLRSQRRARPARCTCAAHSTQQRDARTGVAGASVRRPATGRAVEEEPATAAL